MLIIKMASLGDIIQISPVIDALSEHDDVVIDVLTFEEHRALFQHHPKIRQVIGLRRSVFSILKTTIRIIFNRYDIGFNFHRSTLLDALMFFCRIKCRFGFSSPEKTSLFLNESVSFDLNKSRHQRYLSIVKSALGGAIDASSYGLSYYKSPGAVCALPVTDAPYIVIAPYGGENRYSSMVSRVWGGYPELIQQILQDVSTHHVILTGGPSDEDNLLKLKNSFDDRVHVFVGNYDELALLLESAVCFIGNDSFPLFMAIASKCKALAIFGPTDARLIVEPYKNTYFIQSDVDCSPCYNPLEGIRNIAYNCPYDIKCMTSISIQKVFNKLKDICF